MSKNISQEVSFGCYFTVIFWAFPVPEVDDLVHLVYPFNLNRTANWIVSLCKAHRNRRPLPWEEVNRKE